MALLEGWQRYQVRRRLGLRSFYIDDLDQIVIGEL